MTSWNYRVLRYSDGSLGIHEVYYDEGGKPSMCTVDGVSGAGEDIDELRRDLKLMAKALEKPILEYEYFPAVM